MGDGNLLLPQPLLVEPHQCPQRWCKWGGDSGSSGQDLRGWTLTVGAEGKTDDQS